MREAGERLGSLGSSQLVFSLLLHCREGAGECFLPASSLLFPLKLLLLECSFGKKEGLEESHGVRIGHQHLQAGSLLQALTLLGAAASGQEVK